MNAPNTSRRGLLAGALALPAVAAPTDPDGPMIALCGQHAARIAAVNNDASDVMEGNPIWDAYCASRDAISDWEPATLGGFAALARVALVEATNPSGTVEPAGSMAADWSWNVTMGVLRLHSAAIQPSRDSRE